MSETTENVTDTTKSVDAPTSAEDKFFGVKTQIAKSKNKKEPSVEEVSVEQNDFDLEIIDDKPPKKIASDGETDDELDGYSKTVRKRLDKATFKRREAERLADEAVKTTQQLHAENQQLKAKTREQQALLDRGETVLVSQIKEKASLAADKAKAEYRKAYEEGNTDAIVASQEQMIEAQARKLEAQRWENQLPPQPTQEQQQQAAYQQQMQQQAQQPVAPQIPEPEPKAKEWGDKNSWFGDEAHKGMTAYAYALHEEAIKDNGLSPNSDQYFEYIDKNMRSRFNDYAWSENVSEDAKVSEDTSGGGQTATSTAKQASSVVAPSARNNGAKPRKVKLTSTQVALAKRLGLTNQQYANQVIKEMSNG